MEDVLIGLGASFVLAFVVAGPKARRSVEVIEPAKAKNPKKEGALAARHLHPGPRQEVEHAVWEQAHGDRP